MSTPERTFGGRYAVIERAGSGGMAEVYRARDELLGREVAVKVLSQRLSTDQTFVERFRREAQAAANLNHPNIVALYDFGADDSTYYIVMEFIDGRSLADVIKAEGPLMPERAAEIAIDVARALERAHGAGLVHRDIKPSNIMLSAAGQTKVTDFGIARALTRDGEQTVTQTGMVIGTAAYLSPEQAQGNPVDQRSDVYSLGCVLYEMLGGRPPFSGDTPLSVAYRHVRDDAEPPSRANPDVPAPLDAVVMKALAKNPENRYQTATELRDDLERYLSGQKVAATPLLGDADRTRALQETETAAAPPPEKKKSRAWLWILGGLALLAALIAFLIWGPLFGNDVTVPRLIGLTQSEAEDRLEELGLEAEVEERPHPEAPVGEVVDQEPNAGGTVEEGGAVTVIVSSGPKQVEVPDLRGLTEKEAKKTLKDEGLKADDTTKVFSEEEKGTVVAHEPGPGAVVDAGTEVDLQVSKGPQPVLVPGVIGQDQESAKTDITNAGLRFEVEEDFNDEYDEGVVFDQDPEAGEEVAPDSVVTIFVSQGPKPFELDDYEGEPVEQVRQELTELGLEVTETQEVCDEAIPPNHVCRTEPPAGSEVRAGDTVTIFVQPPGGESPEGD